VERVPSAPFLERQAYVNRFIIGPLAISNLRTKHTVTVGAGIIGVLLLQEFFSAQSK
jgi:hypothetical protein